MNERINAWLAPLNRWWQSISLRERRLVLVASALFVFCFIYWGILKPLSEREQEANARLNSEKQLLQWVTNSANNITTLRKSTGLGNQASMPLNQVISSTASRFKIELIRTQPKDETLQVWIQPIPFNSLANWLVELRSKYGLQVLFLDIDRTDQQGVIEINRLQFKRG